MVWFWQSKLALTPELAHIALWLNAVTVTEACVERTFNGPSLQGLTSLLWCFQFVIMVSRVEWLVIVMQFA